MPRFACDECGQVFEKKAALQDHVADAHPDGGGIDISLDLSRIWARVRALQDASLGSKILIGFAAVLMSTLFLGTASYASSLNPGGGGNQQSNTGQYRNPLTGYATDRVPDRGRLNLTGDYVYGRTLTEDEQIYVLTRGSRQNGPAMILAYNCGLNCGPLMDKMGQLGNTFAGYVYIMPYSDLDSTAAVVSIAGMRTYDEFAVDEARSFICQTYRQFRNLDWRPIACTG